MLQLIADSGATKIDWLILSDKADVQAQTKGFNPNYSDPEEFEQSIKSEILELIPGNQIDAVHFYGAGCSSKVNRRLTTKILQSVFNIKNITVKDDLLGAARASCKNKAGFVSILGTGSNFCKYNGKKITFRRISMGYLLSDEGSAYAIGKSIVQNFISGTMSLTAQKLFLEQFNVTRSNLIPVIYSSEDSHQYIASFSMFAFNNQSDKTIYRIIYNELDNFVKKHLLTTKRNDDYLFHFVGSIAYHFSDILAKVISDNELKIGSILKSPIEEIASFHRNYEQLI